MCSLNVRGLGDRLKRREMFNWLRKKNYSIYMLQEVYCSENTISVWSAEWGYKTFFSCCTSARGGCKSTAKMLLECEEIDLAETGNLYRKVPLRFFTLKKMINLKGTSISPKDFLKLIAVAKELRILNLESCAQVTERSIFQAKPSLRSLRKVNVSHNEQLSVLSVACLCSYQSLQEICARGLKLDENELLFLVKTFPQLANGQLDLETNTAVSDYFF